LWNLCDIAPYTEDCYRPPIVIPANFGVLVKKWERKQLAIADALAACGMGDDILQETGPITKRTGDFDRSRFLPV
jgi:hypothetical protein